MGNTKFSGRKNESGIPGIPLGKPIATFVASTRLRSFLGPCLSGHRLGGGGVPFITQSRKAARIRLTSPVAGTGLASSVPRPQLLPGQLTGALGGCCVVVPLPPPCVELGR